MDEPRTVPGALPGPQYTPTPVAPEFLDGDDFPEPHMEPAPAEAERQALHRAAAQRRQLVDLPGVGPRSIDPGRPYEAGVVPQPLNDLIHDWLRAAPASEPQESGADARDGLIIPLLFAAKRLLEKQITTATRVSFCRVCGAHSSAGTPVAHQPFCEVGELEQRIEALFAWQQASLSVVALQSTGKEALGTAAETLNTVGPALPPAPSAPAAGVVSELDQLARKLADEGAESVLESSTYGVGKDHEWRVVTDYVAASIADELSYLTLRGVLVRHPENYPFVRIDWSKGGAR